MCVRCCDALGYRRPGNVAGWAYLTTWATVDMVAFSLEMGELCRALDLGAL